MDKDDVVTETWLRAAILVSSVAAFKLFQKAFKLLKDS